ncbi:MAG: hypothetical protein WBQ34_08990 [Candidatus Acidiferrales bacterium]
MKCSAVVLGVVLLAATVSAQSNSSGPELPAAPGRTFTATAPSDAAQPLTLWADAAPGSAMTAALPALPASSDPAAAQYGPVIGVRAYYNWQIYGEYTFFNFYEVPNLTNLENGFDLGVTYYPHAGWIGFEGNLMSTFGAQAGCISKFSLASGGARLRWPGPRGTQFFLHGLVGGAHFLPQTAYGGQNALGYQVGGGVDILRHRGRIAFRGEVDAVGTKLFTSYQISPKVSLGVVFNF